MSKVVFLRLGQGSLQSGFSGVEMRLEDSGSLIAQKSGYLPAAADLDHCLMEWQFLYEAFYDQQRYRLRGNEVKTIESAQATSEGAGEIEFEETGITGFSEQEFRAITQAVSSQMQTWLNAPGMLELTNLLRTRLQDDEEIRVIIETPDPRLQQLPWHCWQFFADYRHAEPSFSAPEFEQRNVRSHHRKPRILAVLGNREGIDSTVEEEFLRQLKAETVFLVEPSLKELTEALRHPKGWDIFFFSGHSSSQTGGQFFLNATDIVTVDDLRYALLKAIALGLKLAIFNSCDGSKLAQDLQGLDIPTAIVMKEPVPNQVAQDFLRSFLQSFATGASLPSAVRDARESLQGNEREFPCASWLPGIWQNPAAASPLWHDFESSSPLFSSPRLLPQRLRWQMVLATSLVMTSLVIGARSLGVFQSLELKAFDHLMQLRPIEGADPRLLVIGITQADINDQLGNQEPGKGSLRDKTLQTLLTKLDRYQPRAIGMDILRDHPVSFTYRDSLGQRLSSEQPSPLIAICRAAAEGQEAMMQPPEIPLTRTGFNNVPHDFDNVTRLHLLTRQSPKPPCLASTSFGLQLALHYLKQEGIQLEKTSAGFVKLGGVVFSRLNRYAGGYQNNPYVDAKWNQVLINYRPYARLDQIAQTVSLNDVLSDRLDPNWVKDKVILIGRSDTSSEDVWSTPYSLWGTTQSGTPGVYIHAQALSQILAAVLDKRPLLWWLPLWADGLWIGCWAAIGGILAQVALSIRLGRKTWLLLGLTGTASIALYGCCWLGIQQAGWLPLIPALLALNLVSLVNAIYLRWWAN